MSDIKEWHYRGKKLVEMNKTELLEVIAHLSEEWQEERRQHNELEERYKNRELAPPNHPSELLEKGELL